MKSLGETIRSWRLNERHYGALQGHLKDSIKLIDTFGEEKILEWRRSYDVPPPSLYDQQFANDMGMMPCLLVFLNLNLNIIAGKLMSLVY